ncbi:MAG: cupin domain-containing protein [Flavobacteriales bacterium]|nr:cupin domain-containing protein [Flavobacteriales bacterium]HQV51655.1 cupin domain-containing protein [Flavobacteriales bacterium]HQX29198.1 cupin domain-containing protein [Flavobacteriales bacterium]HQX37763.1 cupin domain-containing protein [Flavobacteriales bacterium]HQZ91904.1 cupin domain-containing protein [Flavobacteriales bacterium]
MSNTAIMQRRRFVLSVFVTTVLATLSNASNLITMPIKNGFITHSGEARNGKHLTMKGVTANTLDMKIGSADTDGGLAVFEQIGKSPNGGPPLHIHADQDEYFHVLEGKYRFQVGEQHFPASIGDTIFLPRGVPHAFIQLTDHARMLVTYQPAGDMEAFFQETAQWTLPPSKEEVARVFRAHGMEVVGPPLQVE